MMIYDDNDDGDNYDDDIDDDDNDDDGNDDASEYTCDQEAFGEGAGAWTSRPPQQESHVYIWYTMVVYNGTYGTHWWYTMVHMVHTGGTQWWYTWPYGAY